MRSLPYPPDAEQDPGSLEMLRGWIIASELQVAVSSWVWQDEPAQWGRLVADTVGHLSDAISRETSRPKEDIFDEIACCLRHYLNNPRELEGDFVGPKRKQDS